MTFDDFKRNVKKEYNDFIAYYKNPKNWDFAKIGEMSLFWFLVLILGFLSYFLLVTMKIVIPANFDSLVINSLMAFTLVVGFLLFELFYIFSSKNGNISPYFLALSFIIVAILPSMGWITKTIIIALTFIVSLPSMYQNWIKVKWPIIFTIFLIVTFLIISLLFISNEFGNRDITILFNKCEDSQKIGVNMKCNNILGRGLIADYETICSIDKEVYNLTGEVIFTYANGSKTDPYNFSETIKFLPPEKTESLHQKITAYDSIGSKLCMDVVWNEHVPSYEEYRNNRNNFIYYFILIFAAAFYTIPMMVKELWAFFRESN